MSSGWAILGFLAALVWAFKAKGPIVGFVVLIVGSLILGSVVDPIREFFVSGIDLGMAVGSALKSAIEGKPS